MRRPRLERLRCEPRLYVARAFASTSELAHLADAGADTSAVLRRGLPTKHDETGFSFELPVGEDPLLAAVVARMYEVVGFDNDAGETVRYRRYGATERHPPHEDAFAIGGSVIVATAMLCVVAPERGGETRFPHADPPIAVAPHVGQLLVWFNHLPNGRLDPRALHESLPVVAGEKVTITCFLYKPVVYAARDPLRATKRDGGEPARARRFFCLTDGTHEDRDAMLRDVATRHGLDLVLVDAASTDFDPARRPAPGDLLHRFGRSLPALWVERFLRTNGVVTAWRTAIEHDCLAPASLFDFADLPVPRMSYVAHSDSALLASQVEALGGYPVVVEPLGTAHWRSAMRVDTPESLRGIVQHALVHGTVPLLRAHVADATHWRVVVLAGRAIATYRADVGSTPAAAAAPARADDPVTRLAERASRLLETDLESIDILQHASGRCFVVDAPGCDVFETKTACGVDVLDALVAHLLRTAVAAGAASRV